MAKFNLTGLMNEHSKNESDGNAFAFKIEHLDIGQIEPSKLNFYNVDDVAELKASIELYGVQQNLVVRKREDNPKFELLSGERRYTAISQLVAEGKEDFRRVPCKIVKSIDDIQAELQLILANSTSRRLTDYELTHQAQRLKELLTNLKKSGFKFTGKKRDIVADLLKVSSSQIARYESINKNLSPELKDEFKREGINVTTAFELSRLDRGQQAEALVDHKNGVLLTPEAAKERRGKPIQEATPPKQEPEPEALDTLPPALEQDEKIKDAPDAGLKFKPCPFCGSTIIQLIPDEPAPEYWMECKRCNAAAGAKESMDAAMNAWNTRV